MSLTLLFPPFDSTRLYLHTVITPSLSLCCFLNYPWLQVKGTLIEFHIYFRLENFIHVFLVSHSLQPYQCLVRPRPSNAVSLLSQAHDIAVTMFYSHQKWDVEKRL